MKVNGSRVKITSLWLVWTDPEIQTWLPGSQIRLFDIRKLCRERCPVSPKKRHRSLLLTDYRGSFTRKIVGETPQSAWVSPWRFLLLLTIIYYCPTLELGARITYQSTTGSALKYRS
ncbi:hypothetical protein VTN96DRAFT_4473 [Rasamsonia emersonii]